jgi:cell division protein FtsZ
MDQLKGTGTAEPDVIVDSMPELELPKDDFEQEVPSNILVPVEADDVDTVRINVTDKVQEEEMTMTGPGGIITINRPDSTPNLGLRPEPADDSETLVMDDEDRPGDADLIRRMVDAFVKGAHVPAELDRPTFERNKTLLYALPMLPEHEFVRSKLND